MRLPCPLVGPLDVQADTMGTKHKEFTVLCSDAVRNRFIEGDQSKNIFGSHYHVRECQTQTLPMGFPEFAQCAQIWTSRLLYFKVRAASTAEKKGPNTELRFK